MLFSPITHASIFIKRSLEDLLLEGMFFDFLLVDFNTEAGPGAWPHNAAFLLHEKAFADHIGTPRDVIMHAFTNDVSGGGKPKFQRGRSTHGPLGIVGGN